MANPQLENGYTRIANEILEALMRFNLAPYERRFLDCVIRFTYGYQRKEARLSLKYVALKTGIEYRHCQRAKKALVKMRLIEEKLLDRQLIFSFQKDHSKWNTRLKRRINPENTVPLFRRSTPVQGSPKQAHIKERVPKENSKNSERNADLKKEIGKLADRKGFGGATHEWQDAACRAWDKIGLPGSPTPSFFKKFRDHRARAESVAAEVIEVGPRNPEAYFYKLLSVRLKGKGA